MENKNLESEGMQGGADPTDHKEKTFTQEQVNEIVRKRLAKVKQPEVTDPPEDYTAKAAALTAKESRLDCREYLTEKGYPKELLEALDTSNVEEFKKKADVLNGIYWEKKLVQPFGDAEFDGNSGGTLKSAFSHGRKHTPDKKALGL